MRVSGGTTRAMSTSRLARASRGAVERVAARPARPNHHHRRARAVSVVAKKKDDAGDADDAPRGFPLKKGPAGAGRGPGAAPLRMETDEQRKFGYGGDGVPPGGGGGDDDDEEAWDDGWNPGGEGQPSTWGLIILLVVGAWALWEYKRPGGSLNPETKRRLARRRYERAFKAKYGYLPGERPPSPSGGTGSISGLD